MNIMRSDYGMLIQMMNFVCIALEEEFLLISYK